MRERKMGECKECGEIKKIQCRGICAACYARLKTAGTIDEKYPTLRKPRGERKKKVREPRARRGPYGTRKSKTGKHLAQAAPADIEVEADAIRKTYEALAPLDSDTREAVIDYVCNRLAGKKA